MRFNRILCAFDASPPAQAALTFACQLARGTANLLLCRIVERARVVADIGPVPEAAELADEVMAAAERELELTREAVAAKVGTAQAWTRGDSPVWDALVAEATRWRADVIVIGAGGRRRGSIGPTAERVIRHAPCPVLLVTGPVRPLTRLLCAVDFSAPAREAFRVAADLAAEHGAGLTLLHAVSERAPEASRRAEETLGRWAEEVAARPRPRIQVAVVEGRASDVTVEAARAGDHDLIIAGSHGRTGITRVLIGSVAEDIVRWADRPVLVVR